MVIEHFDTYQIVWRMDDRSVGRDSRNVQTKKCPVEADDFDRAKEG